MRGREAEALTCGPRVGAVARDCSPLGVGSRGWGADSKAPPSCGSQVPGEEGLGVGRMRFEGQAQLRQAVRVLALFLELPPQCLVFFLGPQRTCPLLCAWEPLSSLEKVPLGLLVQKSVQHPGPRLYGLRKLSSVLALSPPTPRLLVRASALSWSFQFRGPSMKPTPGVPLSLWHPRSCRDKTDGHCHGRVLLLFQPHVLDGLGGEPQN